jgi:hypothetical protein
MRNYKALQKEVDKLFTAGLENFENGALDHLNPNLTIDDQAELLPYDKRYEFPIEKLKLGLTVYDDLRSFHLWGFSGTNRVRSFWCGVER